MLEEGDKNSAISEITDQMSDLNMKKQSTNSTDVSSSSSNTSPRRLYNQNKIFKSNKAGKQNNFRDDSQEESLENDSDLDSTICINNYSKEDDILYQLIKSIFQICIEIPIEYGDVFLNIVKLNENN